MPATVLGNGNTSPILREFTFLRVRGWKTINSNVYNIWCDKRCGENKQVFPEFFQAFMEIYSSP